MRIGLITGEYPPMQGGVGDYTRALAEALVHPGHEVFVLTDHRAQPVTELPMVHVKPSVVQWGRWGDADGKPTGAQQAVEWVQYNQLEVVVVQYQAAAYNMHAAANDLPRRLRQYCPVITTFHDLRVPYLFPKAGALRKRIVYRMAQRSSGVIVTNIADELELKSVGNMPPLERIPIGSNIAVEPPQGFSPEAWRAKLHVPEHVLLVGYFGFINATKGVDTLANALRLLMDRDEHAELLVIGGQTGDSDSTNVQQADEAERLLGGLGINRRVHWTGFVDAQEVSAYLLTADVIALPFKDGVSFRRGTLMAALAHGCPIVTTHPQVEVPELTHGENVYLIPPDRPDALADALQDLYFDREQRRRLGAGALKLARHFQWDTIAAQVVAMAARVQASRR
jgi:glycosyltransferase involved in cell wall biosynthesis